MHRSRARPAGAPRQPPTSSSTSAAVSPPRAATRSGRRSSVRRSAWARRQRPTSPWSPERRTSGTAQSRNPAGRVYCGYSSSPSAKLSSAADSSLPSTPGHEAGHRLDHDQGGQLAAGQHDVADRQLAVDQVVGHPLVDPLVAAAEQREAAVGPASSAATAWSNRRPAGRSRRSGRGSPSAASTASTAAKTGSGISTIPAPPPNGASSTDRCGSRRRRPQVVDPQVERRRRGGPAEHAARRVVGRRGRGRS